MVLWKALESFRRGKTSLKLFGLEFFHELHVRTQILRNPGPSKEHPRDARSKTRNQQDIPPFGPHLHPDVFNLLKQLSCCRPLVFLWEWLVLHEVMFGGSDLQIRICNFHSCLENYACQSDVCLPLKSLESVSAYQSISTISLAPYRSHSGPSGPKSPKVKKRFPGPLGPGVKKIKNQKKIVFFLTTHTPLSKGATFHPLN